MKEFTPSEIAKRKISESMMVLLHKNDFHSISITDITREAEVSRATFYRHFSDKVSVVHYYFDKIVERFDIASVPIPSTREDFYQVAIKVLSVIKKNKSVIKLVIKADDGAIILKYLDAQYAKPYKNDGTRDMPLKPYIYSGAVYNLILKWLAQDCKTPVDEVADMLISITPRDMYGA